MLDTKASQDTLLRRLTKRVKRFFTIRESAVFAVLVIAYLLMWTESPMFRSLDNHMTVLRQMTVIAVLAIGQTLAYISGGFDLSQPQVATLVGILSGWSMRC